MTTEFGPVNVEHVLQDATADREYSVTLVAVGMYKDSVPVGVTCLTCELYYSNLFIMVSIDWIFIYI